MVNYNDTIIYKLCCRNTEIKNIYVGHTCNFNRRKYEHKFHCNNKHSEKYNFNVYRFIRDNGGWNNFDMIMIEEYPCENKLQAERKEREYIENLNATLNCSIPTRSKEEYNYELKISKKRSEKIKCECECEISLRNISTHKKSNKHLELMKLKTES